MAPLTPSQKSAITQFVSFTQADKKTAEKILKQHNFNVEQAVDGFFSNPTLAASSSATSSALSKLFDKYRDDAQNNPDTIFTQGAMTYFQDVSISVEDIGVLLISELLSCPTLGEITRTGFISGWTTPNATTLPAQKQHLAQLRAELADAAQIRAAGSRFRRVYKHTFRLACAPPAKSVPLDMAGEYWKILFSAQGLHWVSARDGSSWLDAWLAFLDERWKKAVNRDLWEQTLLFALQTLGDESLEWWSEESAWPGVIDEFVGFVRKKRGEGVDTMEVE